MENLYLETENGTIPIDKDIIKKYHLKKGTYSPFSHQRIVGENSDFNTEELKIKKQENPDDEKPEDDSALADDGIMLQTSEILDIASGADSPAEQDE